MTQAIKRQYGREINVSLKWDRMQQAKNVADEITGHMAASDLKKAWRCLKGWCRVVEDRPPKP